MIAYLDCFSGISGDKFLGALVDAGVPVAALQDAIDAVLPGECGIAAERVVSAGIAATRVSVRETREQPARTWAAIRESIVGADGMDPGVRERALAVFTVLAEAEADVHGVGLESVHFHEVGAVDSIADVVGTCAGLTALGVTRLVCSPVAVGSGTVTTAHGVLPVPAPATAALLAGVPVYAGAAASELTTPTGAALVAVLADAFGPMPAMRPARSGYGAGTRTLAAADGSALRVPNVARITLGESADVPAYRDPLEGWDDSPRIDLTPEDVVVLRTNIDHISAERIAYAIGRMMDLGALDAWARPIRMKKGRLGTEVTVLASPGAASDLAAALVRETGTLGVRVDPRERLVAQRESFTVQTLLGPVRVKRGPGDAVRAEHDDLAALASANDMPLSEVEALVLAAVEASGAWT